MKKISRLTAEQRENLVAYLDGELDDTQTEVVEQTLAESEVARREVEALTRTWNLLTELPQAGASRDFASRTISSIKLDNVSGRVTDQRWFQYVRRGTVLVVWLACLGLSGYWGYNLTRRWIPDELDAVAKDYSVIENLHIFQEAGLEDPESSQEFINSLWNSGLFTEAEEQ